MSSFTFKGFQAGSAVAISAIQGTNSAAETVPTWGQGSLGSVNIHMVQGELIAPAAIWFEATDISGFNVPAGAAPGEVYEPGFHDITYIWDFGETGDTQFSAPLNIPDAWDDRNIAYGRRACHVFRNPGAYTVSLWCVDRDGTVGQASVNITISNPDSIFTGARTICFAEDGDFTSAPSGANQVTSISALQTAIASLTQSGRILFRAGSDTVDFSLSISGSSFNQNLRFAAFGAGARPVIRPPRDGSLFSFNQNTPLKERLFLGLDFRGSWDPTVEVGGQDGFIGMLLSDAPNMLTLVHDCRMSGFDAVNLTTLKNVAFTSIISDSIIENWGGYGFFGNNQNDGVHDNSRVAFIGTAIQQNPDACLGPIGLGFGFQMSNEQGPIRYASTKQFMLRSSYLFSNTTWTGNAQPCIRAGSQNVDGELLCDRVTFEGGVNPVELRGASNLNGNFLLDRALILGTADTNVLLKTEFHGLTVRNTYGWMPNVGVRYSVEADGGLFRKDDATPLTDPVNLYSTTVVYLPSGSNNPLQNTDWSTFANSTTENNLHYAPNQNAPITSDNPDLTGTISGVTPRYVGRRLSVRKPSFVASGTSNVLTFAYPTYNDTTLSAGDFDAANGRHYVKQGGNRYYRDQGDLTVTLGSSIIITKTSGNWPAGTYNLGMEYQNISTDGTGASPATVPLPRPTNGTPPYQSGNMGYRAIDDLMLIRRPNPAIPGSPSAATASKGCLEPG